MTQTLRIMPREMRLMSERILSLTALPKGFALMVQDVVMYSEKMGFGGFAHLEKRLPELLEADPAKIRITREGEGEIALDAGGQHAWFVVPSLIDLLVEGVVADGTARVEISNIADPAELGIASGLAARAGLSVECRIGKISMVTASKASTVSDPVLQAALEDGCMIEADQWWRIYHLAQTALTPDSVVSRRHAGPLIVTEDGKVIGRTDNDDDTDISFLSNVAKSETSEAAR